MYIYLSRDCVYFFQTFKPEEAFFLSMKDLFVFQKITNFNHLAEKTQDILKHSNKKNT